MPHYRAQPGILQLYIKPHVFLDEVQVVVYILNLSRFINIERRQKLKKLTFSRVEGLDLEQHWQKRSTVYLVTVQDCQYSW